MGKLLCNMYENVKSCVRNNGAMSSTFDCNVGVRQGCILSPFLFVFFINELVVSVHQNCSDGIQLHPDIIQVFLLLFADDIVMFSSTVKGLNDQIHQLENYCDNFQIRVNMDKTKIIVFKNGGKLSKHEKWKYKDQYLSVFVNF